MTPYYPLIYDQENLHYCIVKHILQYPHPHVYTRQTDWPSKKVLQVTFTLKNIVKSHHQHANKKVIPFQCFPFVTINLAKRWIRKTYWDTPLHIAPQTLKTAASPGIGLDLRKKRSNNFYGPDSFQENICFKYILL